jgi:formate/nitrite transporter FocA (FNT family)
MDRPALDMLLQGIPSGFLIAAMVWMIPSAEGADFWVIVVITYIIALGDMVHVVAGSAEAFLLLFAGDIGLWHVFGIFMAPAFAGNVIGGTVLFALLAYGQVKEEIKS